MVLVSSSVQPHSASETKEYDCDVAIAGAGIVGLTLALALKQSGLRIALVEAKPKAAGLSFRRAYHLTLMTGRMLKGLGVWDQILPQITTFQQIRLAEEHYPAIVDLQPADLGTPELGYVGEHGILVQALLDALEAVENVQWLCPFDLVQAEYAADGVTLTLATRTSDSPESSTETQRILKTRLLVAADGARSAIRQQAGIQTQGWQYWQSCITAVIRPEKSHGNIAREHFWASGPFATLPLPGNRAQIVLTAPHAEAQRWLEAPQTEFLAELERRYAGQLGRIELEGDRLMFPVKLMQSDRYVQPRLALVGDAAHCCHPVGGQGLNLGIRDAVALAQVLQTAHQQGEEIGSLRVLRRYERWRKFENLIILGFTDLLDRCFSNRWFPLMQIRRLGLHLMQIASPLRFAALRLMTGLSGRVPSLAKQPNH